MKQIGFLLLAVATLAGIVALSVSASGHADEQPTPTFGIRLIPGYTEKAN